MTIADLIADSLRELRVINAVDPPGAEDGALALSRLNMILDSWNADGRHVYGDQIQTFALTPGLQPHTIGLAANTPTWTVAGTRPEAIVAANLVLNAGIRRPIKIRDTQWWMGQANPTLSTSDPTDLNYRPDWPNGSVYLWPVPSTAYSVDLMLRRVLASVAAADDFSLPPGYYEGLMLTLAESCAVPFKVQADPLTIRNAEKARARIDAANASIPKLRTRDAGMPGGGRSNFNYLTGMSR